MTVSPKITGGLEISEVRDDGYLVRRFYMGYSRKEAQRLFREEFPEEETQDTQADDENLQDCNTDSDT